MRLIGHHNELLVGGMRQLLQQKLAIGWGDDCVSIASHNEHRAGDLVQRDISTRKQFQLLLHGRWGTSEPHVLFDQGFPILGFFFLHNVLAEVVAQPLLVVCKGVLGIRHRLAGELEECAIACHCSLPGALCANERRSQDTIGPCSGKMLSGEGAHGPAHHVELHSGAKLVLRQLDNVVAPGLKREGVVGVLEGPANARVVEGEHIPCRRQLERQLAPLLLDHAPASNGHQRRLLLPHASDLPEEIVMKGAVANGGFTGEEWNAPIPTHVCWRPRKWHGWSC
mmetsp:Transcript_3301/g.6272  ORF Transcript_3301/g.6272 Transcript_3301/m.6272 type:complete len:282 (+) Transcript_3301:263-1108(+)